MPHTMNGAVKNTSGGPRVRGSEIRTIRETARGNGLIPASIRGLCAALSRQRPAYRGPAEAGGFSVDTCRNAVRCSVWVSLAATGCP
jgi:hypothetical protein